MQSSAMVPTPAHLAAGRGGQPGIAALSELWPSQHKKYHRPSLKSSGIRNWPKCNTLHALSSYRSLKLVGARGQGLNGGCSLFLFHRRNLILS